jgi:RNA polymerase sigma-70 factor (ECF subfamily)
VPTSNRICAIRAPAPNARPAAGSRHELEAVFRALQQMPEPERTAVLMRARDVSYTDIARLLDVSEGAARVKVHRARLKLNELGFGRS